MAPEKLEEQLAGLRLPRHPRRCAGRLTVVWILLEHSVVAGRNSMDEDRRCTLSQLRRFPLIRYGVSIARFVFTHSTSCFVT